MVTFNVRFLGCKVSQADAMLIRDALRDAGHTEAAADRADVHVVNTCALTLEAERKSRQQVNRAARLGATYVTGCAANLNRDQFAAQGVTVLNGSADRIAQELVASLTAAAPLACHDTERVAGRTRAFIKVQNGCDQRCAFCIIPRTRGAAESRPRSAILRDARRRLAEGHPELVLTGINIGTWRHGDSEDLADLICELAALDGLRRLRISSVEPGNVTRRLLDAMAGTPAVARHMHIPLQSADPAVLADMGRSYTLDEYRRAIRWARQTLPGLNITTDVIVGFPTEGDDAFRRTLDECEELGFSKVHVFPYSPRPGTRAADLGDRVSPAQKDARSAALRDLSDRLGVRHRAGRLGSEDVVVVERVLDDGTCTGYGSDYTRFVVPQGTAGPGDMVRVRAERLLGDHVYATPLGV